MTSISGTKAIHFWKAPNHFEIFCFTNQLKYFEWQRSSIHKLFASQQFTKKCKAPKRCLCLKQICIGELTITSSLIKVLWKNYKSNILLLQQDFRVVSLRLANPLTPKSDQHTTSEISVHFSANTLWECSNLSARICCNDFTPNSHY